MRIAFVTQPGHMVLPPGGSLEIWTAEVARRLAGEHDVMIVASGAADETVDADGIAYHLIRHAPLGLVQRAARAVHRLRPPQRPFFASSMFPVGYWIRVGGLLRRRRPNVVHVMNYSQAVPVLRRFVPDAKIVLHMQCEWLNQLDHAMIERRLRHADLIVGCSDHITSKVIARFPEHASRCRTIHNGVDVERLGDVRRAQSSDRLTLLNLGRISPEKGIHVLVEAFNQLVNDVPGLELVVVGDDWVVPYEMAVRIDEDPVVRDLARFYDRDYGQYVRERLSPAAAERTTFTGRIQYEEILRYYARADVFVFPSIFESFAIPPVEAMAAGLPVVASAAGGMLETIVDGETGFLVDREDAHALADALQRLIDDPQLRERFGEAGRARARRFSWERVTDNFLAALEALVAEKASAVALTADAD